MKPIILFACVLILTGCHKPQVGPEKTITPVHVTRVNLYQPKNSLRYSATILPNRQVNLSFRVSGFVAGLHRTGSREIAPGDVVQAGTVLAHLRREDFQASSTQAQSQLEAAQKNRSGAAAQLAQAEASQARAVADFARSRTLIESQSLTRPEFDAAHAQLNVTNAQVEAARAQLEVSGAQIRNAEASLTTAHLALKDTALVAPFTASVAQKSVEVGMLAGPSLLAFSLADIGTVKAVFGVPDLVVVGLHIGQPMTLSLDALPGKAFHGVISAVAAVADAETKLFQVEITIPNRGSVLRPGMIASLSLKENKSASEIAVVPLGSVVRDHTNPAEFAVMVVDGKTARSRRVGLGVTYGELLEVTGVKPGELVVRSGGTMVNDGGAVEVMP